MKWTLIETGKSPAAFNMALDEALFISRIAGTPGIVVRLYGWTPAAVTIGYGQSVDRDVDRAACLRHKVDIARRITGGGAVLHDKEITYSVVAPIDFLGDNVTESYRNVSRALIAALGTMKIEAVFAPVNDILANGKKISGSAQIRRKGWILQHGTILLKLDTAKMFELLPVAGKKVEGKGLAKPADRVTSAEKELGREATFDEAAAALRLGFADWLGEPHTPGRPDSATLDIARKLETTKFATPLWTEKRRFPLASRPPDHYNKQSVESVSRH